MNPSDVGNNDRFIIQEVIKDMAKQRDVNPNAQVRHNYKLLVLNEVDYLTKEAQHALRRTMEKYSSSCRLVLICNNLSRVIGPIQSRCLCVRVPGPSLDQVAHVLQRCAEEEKLVLPHPLAARMAASSERNMRKALLCFEATKAMQYPFTENQELHQPDWVHYIDEIAAAIVQEQSPRRLFEVRGKLYELLVNCIPGDLVLRTLTRALLKRLDASMKSGVVDAAAVRVCRRRHRCKHVNITC